MKTLITILVIGLIAFGAYWFMTQPRSDSIPAEARGNPASADTAAPPQTSKESYDADSIKDELARTGRVIREKAREAGTALSDATADARTTATVKAKLLQESALSGFAVDVDTQDGVVTLSGTVKSHEQVGRAVELAMQTQGVYKVISTLQVKPAEPQAP
jgi:hypothetical protein